jgi:hypothetical protein
MRQVIPAERGDAVAGLYVGAAQRRQAGASAEAWRRRWCATDRSGSRDNDLAAAPERLGPPQQRRDVSGNAIIRPRMKPFGGS